MDQVKKCFKVLLFTLVVLFLCSSCDGLLGDRLVISNAIEGTEDVILIPSQDKDGKWGYVDEDKNWVIEPQYADAWMFSRGMAVASVSDGEYGIINTVGEWMVEPKYLIITTHVDRRGAKYFMTQKDHKTTIYDEGGHKITSTLEMIIESDTIFENDRYRLVGSNNHYGFINPKGEWVIEPKYSFGTQFSEGLASMSLDDNSRVIINDKGDVLKHFSEEIGYVGIFRNGLAPIRNRDAYGYVNKTGEVVIDYKYVDASDFKDGIAFVREDDSNTFHCINTSGETLFSKECDFILSVGHGLVYTTVMAKTGILNKKGDIVLPIAYDVIFEIEQEHYVKVRQDDKYFYVDLRNGKRY
ncbi:WG repeat-containing protein [Myroides odoratimimus]|uniref:WG repeat-containing protein n=1 Tax=Myroides odoratimimus TaxID=76832 RepID=UPI003100F342